MTPSIDPPINPYTHPQVGVSQQIMNLRIELNYLNLVKIYSIFSDLTSPRVYCTCTCMHCIHTHIYHDKHVGGHLQFLYMFILTCVCMCMCVWEHPPMPQIPPPTCPQIPRVRGTKISKNAISLE